MGYDWGMTEGRGRRQKERRGGGDIFGHHSRMEPGWDEGWSEEREREREDGQGGRETETVELLQRMECNL